MSSTNRPASRRAFIKGTGAALGGGWLALNAGQVVAAVETARRKLAEGAPLEHIARHEALVLGAVADQIYPPDDTPGAQALGAVHFIDFAAGGFAAGAWPMVREGLAELEARAVAQGASFHELPFGKQTVLLGEVEDTPFFGMVHFLTLMGCFTLPRYGGNREGQGWAQIGFDRRHVWQPPFGYYDSPEFGGEGHGSA